MDDDVYRWDGVRRRQLYFIGNGNCIALKVSVPGVNTRSMSGRKTRPLDPARSNTLPKYITAENLPSLDKEAKKFLSSSLNRVDRDEIKRLLKKEDTNERQNSAIRRIEEKRKAELEKRKAHQSQIYSMDLATLEDTFHLPGRPDPRSNLPPDFSQRSPRKLAKLAMTATSGEAEEGSAENTDFLPGLLGSLTLLHVFEVLIYIL